jgi:hypothetical protein
MPLFLYQRLLGKSRSPRASRTTASSPPARCSGSLYRKTFLQSARAEGDFTNKHVFGLARELDGGPFFLFVNYLDPHEPYDPQEPFRTELAGWHRLGGRLHRYDRPQGSSSARRR